MALPLLLLLAATTAVTAVSQVRAGQADKIELDQQAEQEKLAAEAKELSRRQQLNKVLAANAVGQSMSGISGEGTPQSISLATARTASSSEALEGLSSRLRQAQLRRQGRRAVRGGKLAAASTLLQAGVQGASLSGGKKKGGE